MANGEKVKELTPTYVFFFFFSTFSSPFRLVNFLFCVWCQISMEKYLVSQNSLLILWLWLVFLLSNTPFKQQYMRIVVPIHAPWPIHPLRTSATHDTCTPDLFPFHFSLEKGIHFEEAQYIGIVPCSIPLWRETPVSAGLPIVPTWVKFLKKGDEGESHKI